MHASTTSTSREASKPKKHKAACDQCNASKVKCPGGGPPCKRCADGSHPCHYSLARRIGKPPGSKNRKTLEKLRQEKEGNLESNNGGDPGGDGSITQNNDGRNDDDEALDVESERREGDDSHDPLQMPSTTIFLPLSPMNNYPTLPDSSHFMRSSEQDFLDGDHGLYFDGGDSSVLHSADLELPDFEELGGAESRRPWADAPDDCWSSSSPSIGPQLSSGPADTDSPLSAFSHSSVFETNKPISLDTVAARLEETTGSTTTHLEQRQPTLCRCLRKYADVLCKLQTIEKRQRSIQVDTLLTCANLVLNITENQLRCTQCLYDSCVAMQIVMIFQTIFTWSQGQCHPHGNPGADLPVTLGQHEMTEEECRFVKAALISKALDRACALLRLMVSRIERVTLSRQGKQSWGHEGAEFLNLQQLVSSLIQGFSLLKKRFAAGQSRSKQATEGR